jgi:RNA-binding protein
VALLREGKRKDLQRIGLVLHTSSCGNMILRAENPPRIGDQTLDENLKPVGMVFDIFGPVSSPYVAVRPTVENPNRFVKHVLYAIPSSKPRREKRKR